MPARFTPFPHLLIFLVVGGEPRSGELALLFSSSADLAPAAADAKAPASDGSTSSPGAPPAPVKTAAKPDVPPPSPTADKEVSSAATDRTPPAEREVAPMPVDRQPPAAVPEAPAPSLPPMATAPAVPDDLLGAYAAPRVLSVRVLVDDTLVRARPDWIDYVQQLVSISSANTSALLGLTLELRGVGRWDGEARAVAASGRGLDAITRDGADVVVLLGERGDAAAAAGGIPPHASGAALVPSVASRRIGGWAVVLGDARDTFSHQGSLMHELGHLLGAEDIADVRAAGWGSGSFMSLAPLADDAAPAIDEENLRRILNRKSWPAARGDEDAEVNHDK